MRTCGFGFRHIRQRIIVVLLLGVPILMSCGSEDPQAPTDCPQCADDLVLQAYVALERTLFDELNSDPTRPDDIDFTEAHDLYRQALAEDANNSHARFGSAVTGLLVLTSDSEINAAFDEWDAYLQNNTPFEVPSGSGKPLGIPIGLGMSSDDIRLPFDVVPMSILAHGQIARLRADPQLGRVQDILRQRVIPKLAEAVSLLGPVGADSRYRFIVSPLMQGDQDEIAREIDQTDVLALRAAVSLLTAASRVAVAYEVNFAAYDSTSLHQAFQRGSGWMALAEGGADHMRTARMDMLSAIDDVDGALVALLAETDSQDDDVIKRGPGGASEADIDEIRNQYLPDIRLGLTVGYTRVEDWDFDSSTPDVPLTINAGNLFNEPVTDWKALLPPYTVRIDRGSRGWDYEYRSGTAQAEVTVPAPGFYSANYNVYFDPDSVYTAWTSGPEFLTDVLRGVLDGEIPTSLTACELFNGSAWAGFSGSFNMSGVHTIQVSWQIQYSSPEACIYIPIIVFDADTFEEWIWPDPTFGGLLPDMRSMNDVYSIFGVKSSDFRKEWRLDWGDVNLPKPAGD